MFKMYHISDIDECAISNNPCGQYAICTNLMGSYNCTCLASYVKDQHGTCSSKCSGAWTKRQLGNLV